MVYPVPSNLDTSRLVHLIEVQKAAAEGHLWALREDPGYFAITMLDYYHYCGALFKSTWDDSRLKDTVLSSWEITIWQAIKSVFDSLTVWSRIL
jgi:hypothetical protein